MKLILTQEVAGLGTSGDVVEVKNGYARNYLLPRGFATVWTKGGEKQVESLQKARAARAVANLEDAQAQAEKLARDQELNRQQQEKAEQKARAAQIKQLIETSRLPKLTTEDYYNFVDDKKVKRLSVNKLMRDKLASGSLAIVRHGGGYEVIPREAALKIQERDPQRVVQLNIRTEEPDADDPYAAYQVPDDLMW